MIEVAVAEVGLLFMLYHLFHQFHGRIILTAVFMLFGLDDHLVEPFIVRLEADIDMVGCAFCDLHRL